MEPTTGFEFRNGRQFADHVYGTLMGMAPAKGSRFTVMFSFCYDSEEFVRDYAGMLATINWDARASHDLDAPKPWVIRMSRQMVADKKILRQIGEIAAMSQEEMNGVFDMWGAICISAGEDTPPQKGLLAKLFGRR